MRVAGGLVERDREDELERFLRHAGRLRVVEVVVGPLVDLLALLLALLVVVLRPRRVDAAGHLDERAQHLLAHASLARLEDRHLVKRLELVALREVQAVARVELVKLLLVERDELLDADGVDLDHALQGRVYVLLLLDLVVHRDEERM
ncbi:MAG: hypothetical protein CMP58_03600 [Flavobacteriales bacterium]|nr:hypothetical protein [Flavobacteriales bacterium]